ncbi:MAG: ABC transporter ATP-binding protein [Chloroflexia bacterium]
MNDIMIGLEGLSKRYVIRRQSNRHDGLRHIIERSLRAPLAWIRGGVSGNNRAEEEFWALRDVNFEIKRGEVVGIIGRNGAGKSTLLKILSRITEPTEGRIRLRGRLSSLLEVGTGFHPELTGRENIYLNGAILGMTRAEIKGKFDEITAFANIERFLDTPVKRYSSGMYVRLAFAVAAHLEPEILVVDEVLAVGDAQFQKKCLDKMDDVGQSGRTVLFVSHNMQAVTRLCSRCIWLDEGRVRMDGPAPSVSSLYVGSGSGMNSENRWSDLETAPGDDVVRLCGVRVRNERGEAADSFDIRHTIAIELEYEVLEPGHIFHPHFLLTNESGVELFVSNDLDPEWRGRQREPGRYFSTGLIPGNMLTEGFFSVGPALMTLQPSNLHVFVRDSVGFRVVDSLFATDTSRGDFGLPMPGLMRPLLRWSTRYEPEQGTKAA